VSPAARSRDVERLGDDARGAALEPDVAVGREARDRGRARAHLRRARRLDPAGPDVRARAVVVPAGVADEVAPPLGADADLRRVPCPVRDGRLDAVRRLHALGVEDDVQVAVACTAEERGVAGVLGGEVGLDQDLRIVGADARRERRADLLAVDVPRGRIDVARRLVRVVAAADDGEEAVALVERVAEALLEVRQLLERAELARRRGDRRDALRARRDLAAEREVADSGGEQCAQPDVDRVGRILAAALAVEQRMGRADDAGDRGPAAAADEARADPVHDVADGVVGRGGVEQAAPHVVQAVLPAAEIRRGLVRHDLAADEDEVPAERADVARGGDRRRRERAGERLDDEPGRVVVGLLLAAVRGEHERGRRDRRERQLGVVDGAVGARLAPRDRRAVRTDRRERALHVGRVDEPLLPRLQLQPVGRLGEDAVRRWLGRGRRLLRWRDGERALGDAEDVLDEVQDDLAAAQLVAIGVRDAEGELRNVVLGEREGHGIARTGRPEAAIDGHAARRHRPRADVELARLDLRGDVGIADTGEAQLDLVLMAVLPDSVREVVPRRAVLFVFVEPIREEDADLVDGVSPAAVGVAAQLDDVRRVDVRNEVDVVVGPDELELERAGARVLVKRGVDLPKDFADGLGGVLRVVDRARIPVPLSDERGGRGLERRVVDEADVEAELAECAGQEIVDDVGGVRVGPDLLVESWARIRADFERQHRQRRRWAREEAALDEPSTGLLYRNAD
jgi:hypothetical protein